MSFTLPKIYPITDTRISGLSHAEQVRHLIAGGAKMIQLREKHAAPLDWLEDAKKAAELCLANNVNLIINDRADIALAIGAAGVHLGQTDMPPDAARRLLGDGAIIGFSTHTVEQVRAAIEFPVDYIAFGPVFTTTTKIDPDAVVGLDLLSRVREITAKIPLVAIGGITFENARTVLDAGADSLAMVSGLVGHASQIEEQLRRFINL